MPPAIRQDVREHLRVRVPAARAVVQPDLVPVAAALQLQVPVIQVVQGENDPGVQGHLLQGHQDGELMFASQLLKKPFSRSSGRFYTSGSILEEKGSRPVVQPRDLAHPGRGLPELQLGQDVDLQGGVHAEPPDRCSEPEQHAERAQHHAGLHGAARSVHRLPPGTQGAGLGTRRTAAHRPPPPRFTRGTSAPSGCRRTKSQEPPGT